MLQQREDIVHSSSRPPLLRSISARSAEEEAAGRGGLPRRQAPFPGCKPSPGSLLSSGPPASPMEPLPTQGQTLRHYNRLPTAATTHTHTAPVLQASEPVLKVEPENEATEGMGRVDEGVEEFFTKKIIPDYALKGRWEESIPAPATPPDSSSTPSASTPFSSSSDNITLSPSTTVTSPSVPSTDTCFTSTDVPLLSTSSTPHAPPSSVTPTTHFPPKTSRKSLATSLPSRGLEAAEPPRQEGRGRRRGVKVKRISIADLIRPLREAKERERDRDKGRGARSVEDANVCNDAATTEGTAAPGQHPAGDAKGTMAPAKTLTTTTPSSDTTPSFPNTTTSPDLTTATLSNLTGEAVPLLPGRPPSPVVTSPLTEQERGGVQMKEMLGGSPFGERRLKVTKRSLREGKSQSLILLTGLEPEDKDDTHSKKHASESTSSFEQRLQVMLQRMGVAKTPPADTKTSQNKDEELRKANSEDRTPLFTQNPPFTRRRPPALNLPWQPSLPSPPRPLLPGGQPVPPPLPPQQLSREERQPGAPPGCSLRSVPQEGAAPLCSVCLEGPGTQERSEKAQSVTDESLPKIRQHLKPVLKRRAVSVHEDTLAMTQELKAVLQRSPIRFRGSRGDLPPCTEDPPCVEEAQRAQEGERRELKAERGRMGCGAETKPPPPGSACPSSTEASAARLFSPTAASDRPPPVLERLTHGLQKPPVTPPSEQKSPAQAPVSLNSRKTAISPGTISAISESQENPRVSPLSLKKKSPGTAPPPEEGRNSTQEELSKQHTVKAADQRTEPPLSE
ncbi:hypothetical protein F7725_022244 [Dissostichus mawsoni]|uniref:CARMIL C-terminal domain-containing protein n=1 Tax=Dissostichus mawsoni TaxID=36200 RepID=A0A7J5YZG6_DISMA|nr:hypothetical protein F7725_022244 [Dissostichus mawsoni]